jgi:hypothetical protein
VIAVSEKTRGLVYKTLAGMANLMLEHKKELRRRDGDETGNGGRSQKSLCLLPAKALSL